MIRVEPVPLERSGIRLEPLSVDHADGLREAASDGELWNLFFTSVPHPNEVAETIESALDAQKQGHMTSWVVRETDSGRVIGSTRFHDIVPHIDRVEIGYTWYAQRYQRTHVNTTCKLLLLEFGFDKVGCGVVGFRTDIMNHRSQRAIEALGAKKDGVLRHHSQRKDGSIRDDVLYSILKQEWPAVRQHLETRLWRNSRD